MFNRPKRQPFWFNTAEIHCILRKRKGLYHFFDGKSSLGYSQHGRGDAADLIPNETIRLDGETKDGAAVVKPGVTRKDALDGGSAFLWPTEISEIVLPYKERTP